jgi:hypothetical protein
MHDEIRCPAERLMTHEAERLSSQMTLRLKRLDARPAACRRGLKGE